MAAVKARGGVGKLKKGDTVEVIQGKERGKRG